MSAWQINGTISRDVTTGTWPTDLAWSALPDAPMVPDAPRRRLVLQRRMAAALRAVAGRPDPRSQPRAQSAASSAC